MNLPHAKLIHKWPDGWALYELPIADAEFELSREKYRRYMLILPGKRFNLVWTALDLGYGKKRYSPSFREGKHDDIVAPVLDQNGNPLCADEGDIRVVPAHLISKPKGFDDVRFLIERGYLVETD